MVLQSKAHADIPEYAYLSKDGHPLYARKRTRKNEISESVGAAPPATGGLSLTIPINEYRSTNGATMIARKGPRNGHKTINQAFNPMPDSKTIKVPKI